jgi:hypothetical protein
VAAAPVAVALCQVVRAIDVAENQKIRKRRQVHALLMEHSDQSPQCGAGLFIRSVRTLVSSLTAALPGVGD